MKRILVTGSKGQLGHDVVKALQQKGYLPIGVDRNEMDLLKNEEIKNVTARLNPDAIIHCGAYTAVDQAETEPEICYQINAEATKMLAMYAQKQNIPFLFISTDYVFDGRKDGVYLESDEPNPVNVYGASKLKGEQYVKALLEKYFIVRTSWVFGVNGDNFIKKMLHLSETHEALNVVNDQVGSPTSTADLAPLLISMLESDQYGVYHVSNEGFCSWFDFAKGIFEVFEVDVRVSPADSVAFPTKAKRPMNSRMSKEKLINAGFGGLPTWRSALENWRIAYEKLEEI